MSTPEVKIGDRVVGIKGKLTVRGNIRTVNGEYVHVHMDGRMIHMPISDLTRINGRPVNGR